ncbi:MAG TPA: lipopolysaccharide heptosyltransferase II [Candidatus Polarisedimenticolia bacterium]|nr:lipopolysaccharide heptosyltransferase II [Candidatus Polarisedimenticolia bacterium]
MARPLLVRLPNWLGDLVQAWPVVRAAAEDRDRPAVFLGPAAFASIVMPRFPDVPYVPWSRPRRFAPLGALKRHRPGTALLLTDSLSSALLVTLAGVPERVGYAAELRDALLTKRVARRAPARSRPRVEEYVALAEAAGLQGLESLPRLEALDTECARADSLLRSQGFAEESYVAIAPGASYGPAKRWAPERFAALGKALFLREGTRTVLVGALEDREVATAVADELGAMALDLTGLTDLPTLVGILDRARLTVSNDSGVMHVAAALGRPTVAVFGSTSPVWSSARAPWVRALYAAYPCSPCFRRTCPIGYGCLHAIEAGEAITASEELLGGPR